MIYSRNKDSYIKINNHLGTKDPGQFSMGLLRIHIKKQNSRIMYIEKGSQFHLGKNKNHPCTV